MKAQMTCTTSIWGDWQTLQTLGVMRKICCKGIYFLLWIVALIGSPTVKRSKDAFFPTHRHDALIASCAMPLRFL